MTADDVILRNIKDNEDMTMSVTFLIYILVENGSLKAADLLLAIRVNPGMIISVKFAIISYFSVVHQTRISTFSTLSQCIAYTFCFYMSFSLVHQTRISTFSTQCMAYTFCVSTGRYTSVC